MAKKKKGSSTGKGMKRIVISAFVNGNISMNDGYKCDNNN